MDMKEAEEIIAAVCDRQELGGDHGILRAAIAFKAQVIHPFSQVRRMGVDPDGFVFLDFDTFDDRAEFIRQCIPGSVFSKTRYSTKGSPYRVTWKLADFEMPFLLAAQGPAS